MKNRQSLYWLAVGLLFLCIGTDAKKIGPSGYFGREGKHSQPKENALRLSFPSSETKTIPQWLVIAGRNVVPGAIYQVVVQALNRGYSKDNAPISFQASLINEEQEVTSGKAICQVGEIATISMKVPLSVVDRKWKLLVEGTERDTNILVFKNSTRLKFTVEFLTILIQTSRPVYNAGQKDGMTKLDTTMANDLEKIRWSDRFRAITFREAGDTGASFIQFMLLDMRFRVILLDADLKPFEDPVFIAVMDPSGHMMRRWPSRHSGNGVINLNFQIPDYPLTGNWTILVKSGEQVQNQTILVEQYFKPRFEVFVRLRQAFKISDEYISGVVVANMTNWRYVHGNCSLKLELATDNDFPIPTQFQTISEQFYPNFTGVQPFSLPFYLNSTLENQDQAVLRVFAAVGDSFGWQIQHGWALTRLIQEKIMLTFIQDQPLFFRPGMPFSVTVFVSYADNHPLSKEEQTNASLEITFNSGAKSMIHFINGTSLAEEDGVAKAYFTPPDDAENIKINARINNEDELQDGISTIALKHHSPRKRHLQVESSTIYAIPGENIILHVRNNFYIKYFNFIVASKGRIIYAESERLVDHNVPTITTFFFPATAEMAPAANVLVWVIDKDGEIISHSISVPINPLAKHQVGVRWNEHKDHTGGSAEVKMLGEKGAFFAASSLWEETFLMDAGHNLDEARVLHHMLGFSIKNNRMDEEFLIPKVGQVITRSRLGKGSKVRLFSTSNTGPDVPSTFNNAGLVFLTDASVYYHPSRSSDATLCNAPQLQCLTGGCYSVFERCDGVFNCADLSDETGCPQNIDPYREFRLHRISRIHRFYDPEFGDWGWQDIRQEGREIQVFTFPKRPQHWVFSLFAVGKEKGLGIMEKSIMFDSAGPFVLNAEAPSVARMWEQVAITVAVFNFHLTTVAVSIILPESPDYESIYVEDKGVVDSYKPRKSSESRHHIVWLPSSSSLDVNIPIVFKRIGKIEVTVLGATQMQKDSSTVVIDVVPEGATIMKHTSVLMDLKSRAIAYEFFNIHLDESPIIAYKLDRRYIFGTPQGHISVTGDVVGPAFPSIPVGADKLLGTSVMGAETSAYNLAANIWTLHYLRLTTEDDISDIVYDVLKAVNVEYAALSTYQSENGGFTNWIDSEPSVWLTAHAIRCLWLASFPDWENLLYIDPTIIRKAVSWLLTNQNEYGSYSEPPHYLNPLNSRMDPRSRYSWLPKYRNISLTAYVVISLCEVMHALDGEVHKEANLAQERAVSYLEGHLETIDDPYDLALVTWALIKGKSVKENLAFSKLHVIKREVGNRIYWSREPIGFNSLVYEDNQRPYIQPKDDQKWDAYAVEATAYALLVYLKRRDLSIIQENIVRFLASMRELDGGLISTVDSLAAMEALVQYANIVRIREVTEMKVFIEHSANPNMTIEVCLDKSQTLSQMRSFELHNLFGHINIVARGSGQALIQLDYTFGVDTEEGLDIPPIPSFDLELKAAFYGRNNSYVKMTPCMRWINVEETETSGLAVLDIHLPSGYYIMQDELIKLSTSRQIKNLRWALRTDKSVLFFFNKIEPEFLCFSYRLERWLPVSNHSRHNLAVIYELYQPERFKMKLFEVFPLYTLDICEVCGSYQCPYCPFYSGSQTIGYFSCLPLICFHGIIILWWMLKDNFFD